MENLPAVTTDYTPFIDRFIDDQDVIQNSKKTYKKDLRLFFTWCNETAVQGITHRTILDYKQKMKAEKKSAYTINLYLQVIKKFFSWAESNKIHKNVAKNIKRVRIPKGFSKEALTREQAQKLILSIENPRNRAMVLLMTVTGLRCIEVTRANVEDLQNIGEHTILRVQGKGCSSKDNFVKVPFEVVEEIQSYLAIRKVKIGDPLFTSESKNNTGGRMATGSISWLIKTALRNIGIDDPRISAHSLRHTSITFALLAGATLQEAQCLARHASITMVLIYSHNIDKLKNRAAEQGYKYLKTA